MTKPNRKKTIILATHSSLPHACLTGIGCKTQDSHREEADAQGLQGFCQLLWRLSCILIDILGRSQDIHRLNGRYTTQSDKFCLAYTMCFLASHSIFHDIGTHQGNWCRRTSTQEAQGWAARLFSFTCTYIFLLIYIYIYVKDNICYSF